MESLKFVTEIKKSDIPSKLIDDLKKLAGLPPYNTGSNICMGDGYFAASIRAKYDSRMIKAAETLIIEPMKKELRELERKYR